MNRVRWGKNGENIMTKIVDTYVVARWPPNVTNYKSATRARWIMRLKHLMLPKNCLKQTYFIFRFFVWGPPQLELLRFREELSDNCQMTFITQNLFYSLQIIFHISHQQGFWWQVNFNSNFSSSFNCKFYLTLSLAQLSPSLSLLEHLVL